MTIYDADTRSWANQAVYTLGIGRSNPDDLQKIAFSLRIIDIFDIRGPKQQRGPALLKPSHLAKSMAKHGLRYHDQTKALGDRADFALFSLTDDFTQSMKLITERAKNGNILVVCAEPDYRKCHRKIVASYLARKGFDVRHLGKGLSISFQSTLEISMLEHPRARRMFTIGF